MLLLRLCLLYLVCSCQASVQGPTLLSVYQSYCPYNTLCNHAPIADDASIPIDYLPCCMPCRCDPQCWTHSDCCPDVPQTDKPSRLQPASCRQAIHRSEKVRQKNWQYYGREYYIVGSCPVDYVGPLRAKCAGEADQQLEMDDVVMVSATYAPTRAFNNKHCAICNGVEQFQRWNLRSERCTVTPATWNLPLSEVERFLLDHCELTSHPPPGIGRIAIMCDRDKPPCKDDNNHTGVDLQHACATSFAPRHPDLGTLIGRYTVVRNNVYCYACSKLDPGSNKRTLCERSQILTDARNDLGYRVFLDITPSASKAKELDGSLDDADDCYEGELFDHITKQCRTVHCVWFAGIRQHACVPFGRITYGGEFVLSVLMIADKLTAVPAKVDTLVAEAIEEEMLERTELYDCPLRISRMDLYSETSSQLLAFLRITFKIIISEKCVYENIMRNLRKHLTHPWLQTTRLGDNDTQMVAKVNFYKTMEATPVYQHYTHSLSVPSGRISGMTRRENLTLSMFSCPYFVLNFTEYSSIVGNVIRNHSSNDTERIFTPTALLHDGFYGLAEDKVAVCTDTYFSLRNRAAISYFGMHQSFTLLCLIWLIKSIL